MTSFNLIRPFFVQNRAKIALGVFFLILVDFMQLIIPRIIKTAVDDVTYFTATPAALFLYFAEMISLGFLILIFRYGWRRLLIGMSREVERDLRNTLFSHVQTLSASFFNKTKTGDIMAHATNDLNHVRMATGMGMVALADAVFMGITSVLFMAYISVPLTLTALIPMPFIALFTKIITKKMHKGYQEVQAGFSLMTESVRERFSGIRIIKSYRLEKEAVGRMEEISTDYVDRNIRLTRITGLFIPMMMFFSNVSLTAVLFLGGRETIYQNVTAGDFVAFINYLGLLAWPMMALGWVGNLIQRGKASLDRLYKILSEIPDVKNPERPITPECLTESVSLAQVTFTYPDSSKPFVPTDETSAKNPIHHPGAHHPALENITMKAEKGMMIGIVGPPGSGKSTLLSIIPRTYDVSSGVITVNGVSVKDMDLTYLRRMISLVPQEPFIFDGTIKDNILMGNPDADMNDLNRAAAEAALEKTLKDMPLGLNTLVGEKGVVLSGGQKQRIALARAFIGIRPIWLLDDPVSQVDLETANMIINNIEKRRKTHTVFIVSHRISTVKNADKIYVMDKGGIIEEGNHASLIQNKGYYFNQFELQRLEENHAQ